MYDPSTHSSSAARKPGPSSVPVSPEPDTRCGELLEHGDRTVVGGNDPVLADDALDRVQLALLVLAGA